MSKYLDERLAGLQAYVPGEQPQDKRYIKLNTNESPFPPAPGIEAELKRVYARLNLYPDPDMAELRDELAALCGVRRDNIFVGNGSDEVLAFCFLAFCGTRGARFADITYGFYRVYADLCRVSSRVMPLDGNLAVNPKDYIGSDETVFIANPNAPTGLSISLEQIDAIAGSTDAPVIIDEAYVDFGGETCLPLLKKHDNLLIVRTFSKSRNLAGGRIGWAVGSKELISDLNSIKFSFNPFNVNMLSQAAALCSLRDKAYFEGCVTAVKEARAFAADRLSAMGFEVINSHANFLFAAPPGMSGREYYLRLKDRGVLVRHFPGERTGRFVRITIGTRAQMETLAAVTEQICKE